MNLIGWCRFTLSPAGGASGAWCLSVGANIAVFSHANSLAVLLLLCYRSQTGS